MSLPFAEGQHEPASLEFENILVQLSHYDQREKMLRYVTSWGRVRGCEPWIPADRKKGLSLTDQTVILHLQVEPAVRQGLISAEDINFFEGLFISTTNWAGPSIYKKHTLPNTVPECLVRNVPKDIQQPELEQLLKPVLGDRFLAMKKLKMNLWASSANKATRSLRSYRVILSRSLEKPGVAINIPVPGRTDLIQIQPLANPPASQGPFFEENLQLLAQEGLSKKKLGRLKRKQLELEEDQSLDFKDLESSEKEMKGCEKPTSAAYYKSKSHKRPEARITEFQHMLGFRFNLSVL